MFKRKQWIFTCMLLLGIFYVGCQPESVAVTRVVTEITVEEVETIETTRVVIETIDEEVEVTWAVDESRPSDCVYVPEFQEYIDAVREPDVNQLPAFNAETQYIIEQDSVVFTDIYCLDEADARDLKLGALWSAMEDPSTDCTTDIKLCSDDLTVNSSWSSYNIPIDSDGRILESEATYYSIPYPVPPKITSNMAQLKSYDNLGDLNEESKGNFCKNSDLVVWVFLRRDHDFFMFYEDNHQPKYRYQPGEERQINITNDDKLKAGTQLLYCGITATPAGKTAGDEGRGSRIFTK